MTKLNNDLYLQEEIKEFEDELTYEEYEELTTKLYNMSTLWNIAYSTYTYIG